MNAPDLLAESVYRQSAYAAECVGHALEACESVVMSVDALIDQLLEDSDCRTVTELRKANPATAPVLAKAEALRCVANASSACLENAIRGLSVYRSRLETGHE